MPKCYYCPAEAKYRASMVVRSRGDESPVLMGAKHVCQVHRGLFERVPDQAAQRRIEAAYRASKQPVPDWALTQVAFEPIDPRA